MLKPLTWYKSLQSVKGRTESGVFLVEGPRALSQILATNPEQVQEIIVNEGFPQFQKFRGNVRILTSRQFTSISTNKTLQGVLGVVAIPEKSHAGVLPKRYGSKILLLEEIQDPGNVGTLIRTAAAFDFSGILLSEACADPFSPKAIQASAGSILSLWIRRTKKYYPLTIELKNRGFSIVAADIRGTSQSVFSGKKKVVLALGNEGNGLSQKILHLADAVFSLPYNAQSVESLNVAAAGAICMYCVSRESAHE